MNIPRVVLAGTHSGVGKTTLATGIMTALRRRSRPVQGYKVGPDYIDPSYHAAATGKPSRNLDRWLLNDQVTQIFCQSGEGSWAVIEGVMGMYDGMSGTHGYGSSADIAKELRAPVILIVDGSAMSRSAAALVHGFRTFEAGIHFAGVVFNRVKSDGQESLLREAMKEIGMPVIGSIPREGWLSLPERHLGLVPVGERTLDDGYLNQLCELTEKYLDMDLVENVMLEAPGFPDESSSVDFKGLNSEDCLPESKVTEAKVTDQDEIRLGIALDEAFLFYYPDALESMRRSGFKLVPFSPLHDKALPDDLQAVMIGGGFPELHLEVLSKNTSMQTSLRRFAQAGNPIYAECGGYMYLGDSICSFQGDHYAMCGIIPMKTEMTSKLQGLGYREGRLSADCFLGPKGTLVRGHEFHYSQTVFHSNPQPAYSLFKGGDFKRFDGYCRDHIIGSYLHIHFAGFPELVKNWVQIIRSSKGRGPS